MSQLDEPLLIVNEYEPESHRRTWIDYLFLPLDALVFPCTYCLKLSCWDTRKYAQYDLSLQLMGIFQTLIGALWASSFISFIQYLGHSTNAQTLYISLYCAVTYALCNILVVIMQRREWFKDNIFFFVGTLGHVVAFGIKALAFHIMNLHFSSSFKESFIYFWICLAVSICCIYGLSVLRKYFCFAMS